MASNPYQLWHYSATHDYTNRGRKVMKGDITEIWVTDWTEERIKKYKDAGGTIDSYAVAVFSVNSENTAEEQSARAKVFCNYMNKLKEAEERAKAGVEMGFLK